MTWTASRFDTVRNDIVQRIQDPHDSLKKAFQTLASTTVGLPPRIMHGLNQLP